MKKDNYIALIYKKLKGDISLEEQSQLDIWQGSNPENAQLSKQLEKDWDLTEQYVPQVDFDIDVDADFALLQQRIDKDAKLIASPTDNMRVANQPIGKVVEMSSKKPNTRWMAWASAAVIALAVGFWFVNNQNELTATDLVVKTDYQKKQTVTLNDGTVVWLNSKSELSYPTDFSGTERLVKLSGEAFFDVTKNPTKPFIIETNNSKVTVLGTSFNVRSRLSENLTEVVVKTGKVRLENSNGKEQVELTANQKGVSDGAANKVTKMEVTDMNDLAWHSDRLIFMNTPLNEVLDDLSRQFEVEIGLKDKSLNNCEYGATHKIGDGIATILNAIADTYGMTLKTKGNTSFELLNGSCQ